MTGNAAVAFGVDQVVNPPWFSVTLPIVRKRSYNPGIRIAMCWNFVLT